VINKKIIILILIFFFNFLLVNNTLSNEKDYFLTLKYNEVKVRQGPSFEYPVKFIYKKKYLPVKIIDSKDNFKKYIEKNCKNVGDNFPREARSIHYDKKTSQGIYGKATPEETAELLEEGIDVATIPWQNKSEH